MAIPSDYFERGSGRLQICRSKAGLVLNETGLNYTNANPAVWRPIQVFSISPAWIVRRASRLRVHRKFHSTQDHT